MTDKEESRVRPIRQTEVHFETEEEEREFIRWATSTEKTDELGINRLRELMKNHTPAPEMTHEEIMHRVRRELKAHQRSPKRNSDT